MTLPSTATRPRSSRPGLTRFATAALVLTVALAASMSLAVTIGPAGITGAEVLQSILSHLGIGSTDLSTLRGGIVWELRLPRVLTAAAVGAGLGIAGVVMQAVTLNALADPYLLGLSSGASLGAVLVVLLGVELLLPVAAFAGAMIALAATLGLASLTPGLSPSRTVLAGIAVSSLASAATSFVIFWTATGDSYRELLGWLLGSLAGARWPQAAVAVGAAFVIGLPLMFVGRRLDAFAFGDATAASLGIGVTNTRWLLLLVAALLTGAMVSVSGSIGFIGLVVPHAVRLLVGARHRAALPLSALAGALVLVWADTIARSIFDPRELPVGIVTALLGAPFFALILARRKTS